MALTAHFDLSTLEQKTFRLAMKIPCWLVAIEEEMQALYNNQTWTLVPRPKNVNVIGSKWIFQTKFKEDGSVERHKARLMTQGYSQIEGLDFEETYNPVIKPTTIRVVLAIAVTSSWKIKQLDVKNAFLHGFLNKALYIEQPPRFKSSASPDYVCKLNRSLMD